MDWDGLEMDCNGLNSLSGKGLVQKEKENGLGWIGMDWNGLEWIPFPFLDWDWSREKKKMDWNGLDSLSGLDWPREKIRVYNLGLRSNPD